MCDQASHTCKCSEDSDCHAEDFCNNDGICELRPCVGDADCNDVANGEGVCDVTSVPHGNCYYCDRGECKPGKIIFIVLIWFEKLVGESMGGCKELIIKFTINTTML